MLLECGKQLQAPSGIINELINKKYYNFMCCMIDLILDIISFMLLISQPTRQQTHDDITIW